jgi:hypothetical protein
MFGAPREHITLLLKRQMSHCFLGKHSLFIWRIIMEKINAIWIKLRIFNFNPGASSYISCYTLKGALPKINSFSTFIVE